MFASIILMLVLMTFVAVLVRAAKKPHTRKPCPTERIRFHADANVMGLLAEQIASPAHLGSTRTDAAQVRIQREQHLNRANEVTARNTYLGI